MGVPSRRGLRSTHHAGEPCTAHGDLTRRHAELGRAIVVDPLAGDGGELHAAEDDAGRQLGRHGHLDRADHVENKVVVGRLVDLLAGVDGETARRF
jgi:hypothetical protein